MLKSNYSHITLLLSVILLTILFTFGCEDKTVFESQFNQEDMTPVFNPPEGTYHTDQTVSITNIVPESIIRYTTDGSNPTDTSYVYADSLIIAASTQLKARAYKAGWQPSEIISANYVMAIFPLLITPAGGNYDEDQEVAITCETPNVTIRYTTDSNNPTDTSLVYTEPLKIDANTTLKVQAFREGWTPSEILTHNYRFRVADPVITPEGGSFDEVQEVSITCTTDGAIIRYTTNGEEPTGTSSQYATPLSIDGNTTLNVQAFREGWTASGTLTHTYHFRVADPVIIPEGGIFDVVQEVRITCTTDGAIIRYTTDGNEPTESSSQYNVPLAIDGNTTLKVQAFREGWTSSKKVTQSYLFSIANPVIIPEGGSYDEDQEVRITCTTDDAIIRYTKDGEEPSQTSSQYTTHLSIDGNTTLTVRAFREGWTPSEIVTQSYLFSVANPVIIPEGGSYDEDQEVRITCTTDGAIIRYTTNGSEPTVSSPQYTVPLNVDGNTILKVQAYREGWTSSEIVRENYAFKVATPAFNPPGGFYQTPQTVTITCVTEGVIIRFTTNGNEPTASSPQYSVPVDVPANATLKAKASKTGWTDSDVKSAQYFSIEGMGFVEGGTFNPAANYTVTLSSFFMGIYEITQSEYESVMGINPSHFSGNPNRPVELVSWFDAIEYCNRRSMQEGLTPVYRYGTDGTNPDNWPSGWNEDNNNHTNVSCNWDANGYRLPTEMEWEFAARGGVPAQNGGTFNTTYAGSNNIGVVAWYSGNSGNRTHDVGTKAANELGLYDMSGNAWEWSWDIYGSYPSGSFNDPKGASSGANRVGRGGSWYLYATDCTVSYRASSWATFRNSYIGFRVARNVP